MKSLFRFGLLALSCAVCVCGGSVFAQAQQGTVVNVNARVFGDPAEGLPALNVQESAGRYLLTEVDPSTDSRAVYTAWSPIASQAAWLNILWVFNGYPGTMTMIAVLGSDKNGHSTAEAAFSDPLNLPEVVVLAKAGYLSFCVDDNILWDNTGGISLRIESAPQVVSVALSPSQVQGGASSTGTVTLDFPAPMAGAIVSLANSNPDALVPASVTIPAGQTIGSFTITTSAVTAKGTGKVSATYLGTSKSANLTVTPINVQSVNASPNPVIGSVTATGIVTLSYPAAPGDITVFLASDNSTVVNLPASVVISAGSQTATFSITTTAVSAPTAVNITATDSSNSVHRVLTVIPIGVKSLSISPGTVAGPTSATGTVTLAYPAAPGDIMVSLTSDTPNVASPPITITIPAGYQSGVFKITTTPVSAPTVVTITASANGKSVSRSFTVRPIGVKSLALLPGTSSSMSLVIGVVTIDTPAPTGGITVTLACSDTTSASLPVTTFTIPQGYTQVSFNIYTAQVTSATTVTISATVNGISVSKMLTINP